MTNTIDKVQNALHKLKALDDTSKEALPARENLIQQLKIDLTFFQNLPPAFSLEAKECILAREVYELATFLSIDKQDIEGFERNMSVLKTYYDEFEGVIPESQKKYAILGLYLLYLLSYNKIAEYHTEIELIPLKELQNVYIKVPVSLETYFAEGSYNKILNQKQNVPLESYNFFINKFVNAIRYENARSAERAYESLKISDMTKMFQFDNQGELLAFVEANSLKEGVEWEVQGDRVYFKSEKKQQKEIPSKKMINLCLDYAAELNKII